MYKLKLFHVTALPITKISIVQIDTIIYLKTTNKDKTVSTKVKKFSVDMLNTKKHGHLENMSIHQHLKILHFYETNRE